MPYKDPELKKLKDKEYYLKNKETIKERVSKWQKDNSDKVNNKNSNWIAANPDKRKTIVNKNKPKQKLYKSTNRQYYTSLENKRRSAKLQRTPSWADLDAIELFYLECPKGFEVDHIIPLQGRNVSGFHILSNLQYLTKSENRRKSNKHE